MPGDDTEILVNQLEVLELSLGLDLIDSQSSCSLFSVSIFLSNVSHPLLQACAPRYVYFSINKRRMEPVGTCFTAMDSFSRFSEYSPCRTGNHIMQWQTEIHENANYLSQSKMTLDFFYCRESLEKRN